MDNILIYPNPVLIKRAQSVDNIDGRVKEIADRMTNVMVAHRGIGLAAPQIGILRRIVIVDTGEGCTPLINPEILEGEGESVMEEGCLSLPTIEVPVNRNETILIRGWTLENREVNLELSGFPGRVYQHEIDHLNGILITHHVSQLKRELLVRKMLKELRHL
jgi:peptide deformylase